MTDIHLPVRKEHLGIVIIPCFNRPEFLHWCLDRICKADKAEQFLYFIKPDYGHHLDVLHVASQFPLDKVIIPRGRSLFTGRNLIAKQSVNLLEGYLAAAQAAPEKLIILIEEDIMIGKDFFNFHLQAHQQCQDIFCAIAVKNPNRKITDQGAWNEYYLSTGDYCSLGVSFYGTDILQFIQPHCTYQYYAHPVLYLKQKFPHSAIGEFFAEQDGLIRRIQEQAGKHMPTAYPYHPRAYHAGFYGKNRGKQSRIHKLKDKIDHVGSIIFSDEAMKHQAQHPEWYEDSIPVPLDTELTDEFKLKELSTFEV